MLRFKAMIDGMDKVRSFTKLIESLAHFNKDYTIVTLASNGITFFRTPDSIRIESMFELTCDATEAFTEFDFEMNNNPETCLSFDVSTTHLIEALSMQARTADSIKISLKMLDGSPILRFKSSDSGAVQDIGIEFRHDTSPDNFRIPESVQETLTVSIQESAKLANILTSLKNMENKFVTIIASANTGELTFKARTSSEIKSVVTLRNLSVKYAPPPGQNLNFAVNEMSVTVNISPMQLFCRTIPFAGQVLELQLVNSTALRLFVHRMEGMYTLYLCNVDVS